MTSVASDLGFAAAIIDGEGCICIHKGFANGKLQYQLTVVVAMTDKPVIDWMHARFGGHVTAKSYDPNLGYKKQWRWTIVSQAAEHFLERIYPLLVAKQRQADVAFLFRSCYKPGANSTNKPRIEVLGMREALFRRMKSIKR